mgnify:CR=1 FL=1
MECSFSGMELNNIPRNSILLNLFIDKDIYRLLVKRNLLEGDVLSSYISVFDFQWDLYCSLKAIAKHLAENLVKRDKSKKIKQISQCELIKCRLVTYWKAKTKSGG